MILLNPGPVTLTERVKKSLLREDLCHREPEFGKLQQDIREKLLKVYNLNSSDWTSILLTGSGTAAVEALITSLVPKNTKLLVAENGVYGERIKKIATTFRIDNDQIKSDWIKAIDLASLERALATKKYSHLALVHHETTTGRLNRLDSIINICEQYGCKILLDSVSSFGAENIIFNNNVIAGIAATANKCLHGVPGVSFVIANKKFFMAEENPKRSLYLNLHDYFSAQEKKTTPYTQSVQCMYALCEALDEYMEGGGLKARQGLYNNRVDFAESFLKDLGVSTLLKKEEASCVLRSFIIPNNFNYEQIHDHLKEKGFIIYSGQGHLRKKLFRLSFMGDISTKDLENLKLSFQSLFS